jgi:hypothetical protein
VQGPRPGSKEEGVLCCTVLVNCTDYGLVLLLYGNGTESCFGIGGERALVTAASVPCP